MADLVGIESITRVLNEWLAANGFECQAEVGPEFAYYHAASLIRYCFWFDEEVEGWFREVMDECGIDYECDSFLLGFLHELGHNQTIDELTDEEYEYSEAEIARIEDEGAGGCEDHMTYFHLPLEIEATRWAVNFINENPDKVADLWEAVQPRIKSFYLLNGVRCA